MRTASKKKNKEIFLRKAKVKDIDEIADLLYITETYPEDEWGYKTEEEQKKTLKRLMKIRKNRFSLANIQVAYQEPDRLVGILLLLEGKQIEVLQEKSEKQVMLEQKGIWRRLSLKINSLLAKRKPECEKEEFYLSNIAIKSEFRGNGYGEKMIQEVVEIAKKKRYHKISLLANNDKLVSFYEKQGFVLIDEDQRRMVKEI